MKNSLSYLAFLVIAILTECAASGVEYKCGVQKIAKNNVIARGQDAIPGSWPWHGAIYHRHNRSVDYACGGTLVSLAFVLTAAHCVKSRHGKELSNDRILVRFGVHDLTEVNETISQDRNVLKIHRFKDADLSKSNLTNDIALLELGNGVQLSAYVHPACINHVGNLVGQTGVVAGWGVTESDKTSAILKIARMPVIGHWDCIKSNRDFFGATLDDSMICAGYTNGTTVCNGDSGGGLLFKRGDQWFVGGIVAFTDLRDDSSNLCNTEGYAAFTNVFFFNSWIGNITGLQYLTGKGDSVVRLGVYIDATKKYPKYLPIQCGNIVLNRIVNGQKARLFEYPWMAILIYPGDFTTAGSIISKRYVLTAAHLAIFNIPYKVRLGEYNLNHVVDCDINDGEECAPPVQDYRIEYIVRHQNYRERINHSGNDIALIRLKHEIIFDDHIQPICLPTTRELQQMRPPDYMISGWGIQDVEERNRSPILLKARVPLVELVECQRRYSEKLGLPFHFQQDHICAGGNETATPCQGDGGGPLGFAVRHRGVRFVQFGIVSFGISCGILPSTYTNVSHHVPWILANMEP